MIIQMELHECAECGEVKATTLSEFGRLCPPCEDFTRGMAEYKDVAEDEYE